MKIRDWNQSDLARASGLSFGAISRYLAGRIPDQAELRKLAHGLQLPAELVFEKAGVLPAGMPADEKVRQLTHLLGDPLLTDEDREEILEQVKVKIKLAEKRGAYRTKTGPRKRNSTSG